MATWFSRVGGAATASIANGGNVYAVTLATTTAPILAINGARQSRPRNQCDSPLAPSLSALAGCFFGV
jgi:hypothetical protein